MPSNINSIAQYGLNAESTSSSWLNFFKVKGRPQTPAEIFKYVGVDLNKLICGSDLDKEVQTKTKEVDRKLASSNLEYYREAMFNSIKTVAGFEAILTKSISNCYN